MFGFGKKKKNKFNKLHFIGVEQGYIAFQLTNSDGETKELYLDIAKIANYLPKQKQVVEKIVTKTQSSIWHVLGMMPTNDKQKVLTAYRKMAMIYHPDHGGSSEAFQTLNNARDKALEKCK